MKKFFFIAIGVLFAGAANAQTYFNGARADYDSFFESRIGFTAGVAVSGIQARQSNLNTGSLTGFNAGLTFDFPVTHTFIIRPEILFAQKGYSATTISGNFTQRSQYIDIPLMAKLRSGNVFSFFVGPQLSYMIASNYSFGSNFAGNQENFKYTGSRAFVAGVFGIGADISNNLDIHARYAIDVKGTNTNGNIVMPSYRNQALQLSVGFKLN